MKSAQRAEKLIAESGERQGIAPGPLTVHADRGPAMASRPRAMLAHALHCHRLAVNPPVPVSAEGEKCSGESGEFGGP